MLAALLLVAACGGGAPPPAAPTPSTAVPGPPEEQEPGWVVGASPLPRRPDGLGQVLPTPPELRDRRLQAPDVLPPPVDGRFAATSSPVTPEVLARMGGTYREGCPVGPEGLRLLTVVFRGFDGAAHTGELVVAAEAVEPTTAAFRRLFEIGFPLESVRLVTDADLAAPPTGDGSVTAAFVCRSARGQTRFSAHAYGLAVDVNPFHNPYVRDDLVLPELASAYVDRTDVRPGMLLPGSEAVRAFTDQGFTWGGDFARPKDYQHMTLTGD